MAYSINVITIKPKARKKKRKEKKEELEIKFSEWWKCVQ